MDILSENDSDESILFTKKISDQTPIINFDKYQVTPIKTNNTYNVDDIIKLEFIDNIFKFNSNKSYYLSIIITLLSIIIGITSCIPLAGYQGDIELLTPFDLFTCIIKAICGGLIFIGCWFNLIDEIINDIYFNKIEYTKIT